MRPIRLILLTLVGLLVISAALPVAAAEDEPAPAETTDDAETLQQGYEPAVIVEPAGDGDIEAAWTTKFLVPTGLLIAAVALASTIVMYFVRVVRTRYKVIE